MTAPTPGWVGVYGDGGGTGDVSAAGAGAAGWDVAFDDVLGFSAQIDSDNDFVGRWLR